MPPLPVPFLRALRIARRIKAFPAAGRYGSFRFLASAASQEEISSTLAAHQSQPLVSITAAWRLQEHPLAATIPTMPSRALSSVPGPPGGGGRTTGRFFG